VSAIEAGTPLLSAQGWSAIDGVARAEREARCPGLFSLPPTLPRFRIAHPGYGQARKSGAARRRLHLGSLPPVEQFARAIRRGVHQSRVLRRLGGQLYHVSVRIAKVDRADELVLGDAARFDAARLALRQHVAQ